MALKAVKPNGLCTGFVPEFCDFSRHRPASQRNFLLTPSDISKAQAMARECVWRQTDFPELTYRQWLSKYVDPENGEFLENRQITEANLQRAMDCHGVEAHELDEIAPFELYQREWELNDSSFAKAYKYLRHLDLSNINSAVGEQLGNLDFIHEHEMH